MGTTFKTKREKFEYHMGKQNSTVSCVILSLLDKKAFSWEAGLSLPKLKREVERRKGKPTSDITIYNAISLINQYGNDRKSVYIRSGIGSVIDENNKSRTEHRYFIPKEQSDVNNEKRDLDHKKEIIENKENHIDIHEKITLPQEQRLAELRE